MNYIDKNELKNGLSIEQVYDLVADLGANPQLKNDMIVMQTICHNHKDEGSYKLYYYNNTKLFKCFTECSDATFDIYDLVTKVKALEGYVNWGMPQSVQFVATYFGYISEIEKGFQIINQLEDWDYFKKKVHNEDKKIIELKHFDDSFLYNLPQPRILNWEQEGISYNTLVNNNIRYNPSHQAIIIPHYDIEGRCIGIRERTLIKEEEIYGKYKPAIFHQQMYNHPLGFSLYHLNKTKENIKQMQIAILFESEKSTLQYESFMGVENDVSCACCGSSLISHQFKLLLNLGIKELVVGFDKQFKEIGDDEWKKWTKKLTDIHNKYSGYCNISFLFDINNTLLNYKDSPTDKGRDIFLELFEHRIIIE